MLVPALHAKQVTIWHHLLVAQPVLFTVILVQAPVVLHALLATIVLQPPLAQPVQLLQTAKPALVQLFVLVVLLLIYWEVMVFATSLAQ